ncbi:hypothetical protein WDZ92_52975, partial [Nostoc sp. NIES-2111]
MLFVPISFVAAILILLLTVRLWRELRVSGSLLPTFLMLLAGLAVLHGLRWGYGVRTLMPLQIALALALPPLAFLSLARLGETLRGADLRHAVPPLAAFVGGAVWPEVYDVAIPAIAIAYAAAVALLALQGPDALPGTRLSEALLAGRALWACAAGLAISGLTDAA